MSQRADSGHTNSGFNGGSEVSLDIPTNTLYHTSRDCIVQEEQGPKESCLEGTQSCCSSLWSNIFRKKTLYKRFPILVWLPQYKKDYIFGDIVAGISVALTVIPQALAYAGIAGLDLQYGLYACFLGCFIYIFIGSSKDVPIGPTAISALLSFQIAGGSWQMATLLTFLTGLIEILMGVFRLGFLIDFVSGPVGAGFTSAVSLIIFSSQMKDFLGIKTSGNTFLQVWISIVNDIHNISWPDFILGIVCITLLLSLRALASCSLGPKEGKTTTQKLLTGIFWTIGTARNALLVCGTAGLGYWFFVNGKENLVKTVGFVPKGLPSFQPPPFHMDAVVNETTGEVLQEGQSFWDMVSTLGSGLIVVPLIALLETMAVVQAFADGKPTDATQELIASGVCNVANSFVQGLRSNGGIARGAILNASGVRTQLSNLYTSVIVIIALLYLTPCFYYIPKAALASIIIAAVIFMVQYRVIKPMWHSKNNHWPEVPDAHPRSLPDLPLDGVCAQGDQQAGPEVHAAGGHRLHPHLWSGLHGRQGDIHHGDGLQAAGAAPVLLQPAAASGAGLRGTQQGSGGHLRHQHAARQAGGEVAANLRDPQKSKSKGGSTQQPRHAIVLA
ncbi:sodium-independent sulfate anion transporter isoform X2 [Drosophila yakuba]|uniref:sodium-independent sulfate anion transporter isoform X2 n=1 Tax=Drosophila yakuba TaxID=7245 RepID=UPI0019308000|nr:sodium-independent sulfate anion transporter isoform X2 [Drosophila yakuba]